MSTSVDQREAYSQSVDKLSKILSNTESNEALQSFQDAPLVLGESNSHDLLNTQRPAHTFQ